MWSLELVALSYLASTYDPKTNSFKDLNGELYPYTAASLHRAIPVDEGKLVRYQKIECMVCLLRLCLL